MPGRAERSLARRGGGCLRAAIALVLLLAQAAPVSAQEPVRIGTGFGLAFLPIYVCEDLKLIEKHGKDVHLDLKPSYQRFFAAAALQDAIRADAIDLGPFGIAPLLAAWERGKDSLRQLLAVSGISSLPLVLLTNRANVRTLADFRPEDRIAVPTASSPQMYLLQMQSEKVFDRYDRLLSQIVVLPHADAVAALIAGTGGIAGYFSSAPYTQIALADGRVHKVPISVGEAGDGKVSLLVLGATRGYAAEHPKIPAAVAAAIDEAAHIIHDDPHRAAQIYLAHEPSKALNVVTVEAVLNEIKRDFGSAIHGVQVFADFMGRRGELRAPPQSWKDIVAPALLNSPST